MTVATKPTERRPLASVQRRVENHLELRLERQAETHESMVDLLIIGSEDALDRDETRREKFKFAALCHVLQDPYATPAQRLLAAEQYRSFWTASDDLEDRYRAQREASAMRRVQTGLQADQMHHDYIADCTGEKPIYEAGAFVPDGSESVA